MQLSFRDMDKEGWDKWQQRLAMSVRILVNQGEYHDVLPGSVWSTVVNTQTPPDAMAWTPPFSFGDEEEFRYGGFTFAFTGEGGERWTTFYRFKGTVDMFRPRKNCNAIECNEARKEVESHVLLLAHLVGLPTVLLHLGPDVWPLFETRLCGWMQWRRRPSPTAPREPSWSDCRQTGTQRGGIAWRGPGRDLQRCAVPPSRGKPGIDVNYATNCQAHITHLGYSCTFAGGAVERGMGRRPERGGGMNAATSESKFGSVGGLSKWFSIRRPSLPLLW